MIEFETIENNNIIITHIYRFFATVHFMNETNEKYFNKKKHSLYLLIHSQNIQMSIMLIIIKIFVPHIIIYLLQKKSGKFFGELNNFHHPYK